MIDNIFMCSDCGWMEFSTKREFECQTDKNHKIEIVGVSEVGITGG